jgi:hypothetical protein
MDDLLEPSDESLFNFNDFKETMMESVYQSIVNNMDQAIKNDAEVEEKKTALNTVLKHFETREEYEKCKKIKEVLDSI